MSKFRKLSAAAAMLSASVLAPNALAITFTQAYSGAIELGIDGFDSGTQYGDRSALGDGTHTICANAGSCDTQSAGFNSPGGIGSEDSWGVIRITNITMLEGPNAGGTLWTQGSGQFLFGIFYGLVDKKVVVGINGIQQIFTAFGEGGSIKIFEHAVDVPTGAFDASRRSAADNYNLSGTTPVNNGNLWLQLDFGSGVDATETSATYKSIFEFPIASGDGSNKALLNVSGGSAADYFDTNAINGFDGVRDADFDVTFNTRNAANWTVRLQGQSTANIVPEPGSLAAVGIALAALALRRRRQRD